ncbi:hypothetical protein V2J09_000908 [Rumex salicifolius]
MNLQVTGDEERREIRDQGNRRNWNGYDIQSGKLKRKAFLVSQQSYQEPMNQFYPQILLATFVLDLKVARTGRVALVCELSVNSTYLRGYSLPLFKKMESLE